MKLPLVDDARNWWRWGSMRLLGLLIALEVFWTQIPDETKAMLPEWMPPVVQVLIAVGAMLARVYPQKGLRQ